MISYAVVAFIGRAREECCPRSQQQLQWNSCLWPFHENIWQKQQFAVRVDSLRNSKVVPAWQDQFSLLQADWEWDPRSMSTLDQLHKKGFDNPGELCAIWSPRRLHLEKDSSTAEFVLFSVQTRHSSDAIFYIDFKLWKYSDWKWSFSTQAYDTQCWRQLGGRSVSIALHIKHLRCSSSVNVARNINAQKLCLWCSSSFNEKVNGANNEHMYFFLAFQENIFLSTQGSFISFESGLLSWQRLKLIFNMDSAGPFIMMIHGSLITSKEWWELRVTWIWLDMVVPDLIAAHFNLRSVHDRLWRPHRNVASRGQPKPSSCCQTQKLCISHA